MAALYMTERKKWKPSILHATPQTYRWNIHAKSCSQWGQQLYFHFRFDVHCHWIWITFLLIDWSYTVYSWIETMTDWERNKNTKCHLLQRFSVDVDITLTFSSQKMRKCKFISEWVEHIIWDFFNVNRGKNGIFPLENFNVEFTKYTWILIWKLSEMNCAL